jgi:hypothetical protein
MHTWPRAFIAGALLAAVCGPAFAQELTIEDVSTGKVLTAAIKGAELPEGFRAVKLTLQGGGGGIADLFGGSMYWMMSAIRSGAGGDEQASQDMLAMRVFAIADVHWTRGQVVRLSGHDYLATYKYDLGPAELAGSGSRPPEPSAMILNLTLVRTDSILSLSPRPTMTKEVFSAAEPGEGVATRGGQADPKGQTLQNLKRLSLALIMYSTDWDDVLPYAQTTKAVFFVTEPYFLNGTITKTLNPRGGEFRFNMSIGGVSFVDFDEPMNVPLFYESQSWPDGTRGVAFCDGHCEFVSPSRWSSIEKNLRVKMKKTAKRPLPANYGADWKPRDGGPPPAAERKPPGST